ncbi:hypothetical protein DL89DRAFT_288747 [Linderina pennispora]|uniref:Uncharacterized protein n=1 Tax=Linderina pennispora TaxID=61395 RepID=A0A1Y1VRL2_9FUNG|nr:uncharacterized protein DL89DRAFT_288747 [Linderina pennispora]ORX63919.1 hypothetical protein DL89DRAFT_288747 [Linderina pennispora]
MEQYSPTYECSEDTPPYTLHTEVMKGTAEKQCVSENKRRKASFAHQNDSMPPPGAQTPASMVDPWPSPKQSYKNQPARYDAVPSNVRSYGPLGSHGMPVDMPDLVSDGYPRHTMAFALPQSRRIALRRLPGNTTGRCATAKEEDDDDIGAIFCVYPSPRSRNSEVYSVAGEFAMLCIQGDGP